MNVKDIFRAFRLPFISASILPFMFGSFIHRKDFDIFGFLCGLVSVVATHVSANLINDYADSKSGADWQDRNFYAFFGGSKLIQEKVLSERFYFKAAIVCALISFASVLLLSVHLRTASVVIYYLVIIFLGWSYSKKPLQFSYRRLGELIIFILFGPALVMGGYFIQTKIFPDGKSFILSLPFGFFTTAILFANEIPDFADDQRVGKYTWVGLTGEKRAYLVYWALVFLGFLSVAASILLGYIGMSAAFVFIFLLSAAKSATILKNHHGDKRRLIESSKLTIAVQTLVSSVLIIGVFL